MPSEFETQGVERDKPATIYVGQDRRANSRSTLASSIQTTIGLLIVSTLTALVVNWFDTRDNIRSLIDSGKRNVEWIKTHEIEHNHLQALASREQVIQYQISDCRDVLGEADKRIHQLEARISLLEGRLHNSAAKY